MTDYLESLPTDEYPMDATESNIFDNLVKADTSGYFKLFHELRSAIVAGILFFILSIEAVETIIQNVVPYAKSSRTSLLFCKTALFIVCMFIVQNYHLVS
jgi:hypothetical protein